MNLAELSIKRPVFITMVTLALVVVGLLGISKMKMELFPKVDFPIVVVTTVYPGAGPEQVETQVTAILEESVNSISGIRHITSTSQEGVSQIVIQFELEVESVTASQDVREKVALVKNKLPKDVEDPVVLRVDLGAAPIVSMVVSSDVLDQQALTEYVKRIVKPRFETAKGVGQVDLLGGSARQINIKVDLTKLNGFGLSMQDIALKVQAGNMEFPGGRINEGQRELLVRTAGRFSTPEEMKQLVIKNIGTRVVRLGDVAEVEDGSVEQRTYSAYNGKAAIGINIIKQSDANTVEAATEVTKILAQIQDALVRDRVKIDLVDDTSKYIRNSVHAVEEDIVVGGILAVVIIFFFLSNGASTLISALAIPTSIIASFGFMNLFGFSLNFMTLLALSLAVGILIDDAIVVIENIYRHLDHGEGRVKAAISASKEIALAVMATTFSLVAVFFPVATMEGIVGRFFFPFGITVSVAVLVSLFVAFTLTPMLSSRLLGKEVHLTKDSKWYWKFNYYFNVVFDWLNVKYKATLLWALNHKLLTMVVATVAFVLGIGSAFFVNSEFMPNQDQGKFTVTIKAPPGTSIQETIAKTVELEARLRQYPEVKNIYTTIGGSNQPVNVASVLVLLKPKAERNIDVFNLIFKMRNEIRDISGVALWFGLPSNVGPPQKMMQISIQGPDIQVSQKLGDKVMEQFKKAPGLVDLETSYEPNKPEIQIYLKRDAATNAGVDVAAVAQSIQQMVDGVKVSDFQEGDQQYEVRLQLRPEDRKNYHELSQVMIKSKNKNAQGQDMFIPLSTVADIREGYGPSKITRYDRQRQVLISANLAGTYLGQADGFLKTKIDSMKAAGEIPPGYYVGSIGMAEMMKESFGNMLIALVLAIVFVYLILASQFESFIQPVSIMISLPLSLIGAFLGLLAFNSTISIMSMIGIIMLFGLVTKNAILLIDFTNQLRHEGYSRTEALLKAGPIRLRPIMMTTLAMIFGMLPVALAVSEGSEGRAPLGQAIIGGLITSTMLTLLVVPVVYSLLDDFSAWFGKKIGRQNYVIEEEPEKGISESGQE